MSCKHECVVLLKKQNELLREIINKIEQDISMEEEFYKVLDNIAEDELKNNVCYPRILLSKNTDENKDKENK